MSTFETRVLAAVMSELRPSPYTVIVVGAGAAGIGAARWLTDNATESCRRNGGTNEFTVRVLEARNRTGGRVHTYSGYEQDMQPSGLYDLGASWVHDPPTNPLTLMAANLKLKVCDTDFEEAVVTDLSGKKVSERHFEKVDDKYEKVLFSSVAKARKQGLHDASLEDIVKSTMDMEEPVNHFLLSGLEFELGASLRNCSACECIDGHWIEAMKGPDVVVVPHLPKFFHSCDDFILPDRELFSAIESGAALDGTDMQHGLRDADNAVVRTPLSIGLNEEVISIDQTDPRAVVVTVKRFASPYRDFVVDSAAPSSAGRTGTGREDDTAFELVQYVADAVIIAVPLGVLQQGTISFSPPLSAPKLKAIQETGFGNVVKVIIEFPQVFWPTHVPFLWVADKALANARDRGLLTYFLNGHKIAGKKVLIGYGLGDGADIIDQMSDEELVALIMARMGGIAIRGRTLPMAPSRVVRTRWAQDPYARGAYSHWRPGNLPGVRAELGRPEGAVWFAGEAVQESSLLSSSVHGAWLSGISAAAAVCQHISLPSVLPVTLGPMSR